MSNSKIVFAGNTLLDVTDTTAVESDVASGKVFHKADGRTATGTSTAIVPSGTTTLTENGTYDVTQYTSAVVNVSGGGATEPYMEETMSGGYRTSIKLYGYTGCRLFDKARFTTIDWNGCAPSTIGSDAFYRCSALTSLAIPSGVTRIEDAAFYDCSSIATLTIPNTVTYIGTSAFYGLSSLRTISIPNSVTYLGGNCFYGCSQATSLSIPNTISTIQGSCFAGLNALTSLTIPSSVTTIQSSAFGSLYSISSLSIPSSVKTIQSSAFNRLGNNKTGVTVRFRGTPTTLNSSAFSNSTKVTAIYVPWASGAVAGAPWGATNATIYYNS